MTELKQCPFCGSGIHKIVALKGNLARLECIVDMLTDMSTFPLTKDETIAVTDAWASMSHTADSVRHRLQEMMNEWESEQGKD